MSVRSRSARFNVSSEKSKSLSLSDDEYSIRSSGRLLDRPAQSALKARTGVPANPTRMNTHLHRVNSLQSLFRLCPAIVCP